MLFRLPLLTCLTTALLISCAWAEGTDTPAPQAISIQAQPAIAMHGTPKYGPDFVHLDYANPDAAKTGTLRLARSGSFDNMNPYTVRGNLVVGMSQTGGVGLTSESLMVRSWDEPFSLYGLIAQTITTPDDRSWVEFTLNPAAHWNDGSPITVEDVLFSFTQLRDHGRPNHRTYYKKVSQAQAIGSNRIRFTFDTSAGPDREMPLIMGLMPILQKKWWQGRDLSAPFMDVPVTSGPYKVEKVEPGRRIVYARDPNYWGKDLPFNRGQWNFERIAYDYYRDDNVALEAFKAGAYDLRRESDPTKWLTGYPASANYIKLDEPNARTEPLRGFIFNTRRPLLADIRVREALTYALDFEWMNRALFGNLYRRASSIYPNSELASSGLPSTDELTLLTPYKADLPAALFTQPFTLPHSDGSGPAGMRDNLRHADELLKQAGWTLQRGMRSKNGQPLQLEVLLNNPDDEKIALELARSLKRLGVSLSVRTVDSAQYQSRLTDYDFDLTINYWASTLSPGNEQVYYWSSGAGQNPGSRNYAGISNPAIDALASSIAGAHSRADLITRAHALDRSIMWGYYVIPLYYLGRDLLAYHPQLARPATPLYGVQPELTWWWKAAQ